MSDRRFQKILEQFKNPKIKFAYIDLFCGAGGTSTGVNRTKHAVVIACVNHDRNAIASHSQNHPNALHFVEDIRTINLLPIIRLVNEIRRLYPHIKIVLWASLECTNFSKAKGGMARNADSRTLAEHLYRYIETLFPDYVQIENVVEFMSWGPLDENGKPVSRKSGSDWLKWREHVREYGYRDDWRELNAADFGAYTSRNRLFGVFAKGDLPIGWPERTHAKNPQKMGLFGADLSKWKSVKDCLDFSKEGESIFTRKKPLVEATLERIYAGLVKFVANGDDAFISKYFSGDPFGMNISVEGPAGTVKCKDGQAAVFITKYNSTGKNGKVSPGISIEEPCHTVAVQQRLAVTSAEFIAKYYGKGENVSNINEPLGTITTKDRMSVVFVDAQYKNSIPSSVYDPAGCLTTIPKLNLVECEQWILTNSFDKAGTSLENPSPTILATGMTKYLVSTNFTGISRSLNEPAPVITANRKHHYLINPQFESKGGSVDDPAFTLIARMDKAPPYIATAETGEAVIIIYDNDSAAMKKIKVFMAHFGIVDIKMRMLLIPELLRIQGFGDSYVLHGTQTEQKKYIGNAVVPEVVEAWVNAMAAKIESQLIAA